jgi:hypothetical protein
MSALVIRHAECDDDLNGTEAILTVDKRSKGNSPDVVCFLSSLLLFTEAQGSDCVFVCLVARAFEKTSKHEGKMDPCLLASRRSLWCVCVYKTLTFQQKSRDGRLTSVYFFKMTFQNTEKFSDIRYLCP